MFVAGCGPREARVERYRRLPWGTWVVPVVNREDGAPLERAGESSAESLPQNVDPA